MRYNRRHPVAWIAAAAALWLLAVPFERTTTLEIWADGGRLQVRAAGSELEAPFSQHLLTGIEIEAADSVEPPGGLGIELTAGNGVAIRERLPRRFAFDRSTWTPVGDWLLDDRADRQVVWRRPVHVRGPYSLRAVFRGRFHQDLIVRLEGPASIEVALRRGLINNDLFIRGPAGAVLAATSIDPTPLADLTAVVRVLLRSSALACLLIGCFTLLARLSDSSAQPAATRSPPAWPAVFVLAAVALGLSIWTAGHIMEGLPHQPDSLAYLLQARWISHGSLEGEVSPYQDRVQIPYTYLSDGRWLPHYPPGWPLLLASGLAVGHPWLVAPLLGALFVVLVFLLGRETGGPAVGLAAAVISLVSPLTRLLSGSMLSHAAAGAAVAAVLWLGLVVRRTASWQAAAAAGGCTAWVFATRPLTAVAVALPLALYVLAGLDHRDSPAGLRRAAAVWLGVTALGSIPVLVANALITGSPLSFPYALAGRAMFGLEHLAFGIRNLDAMVASGHHLLFGWSVGPWWIGIAVPLALAVVPFLARRARGPDLLLAAVVLSVVLAHLGTRGHGLHGFGPRYHFEALAALFVLTARGFQVLSGLGIRTTDGRRRFPMIAALALFVVLNASAAATLPGRLMQYRGYNGVTGALENNLRALGKPRLLVALPPDDWQGWAMAARLHEPRPGADLLFVEGRAGERELFEIAEDRAVYIWDGTTLISASDSAPDRDSRESREENRRSRR